MPRAKKTSQEGTADVQTAAFGVMDDADQIQSADAPDGDVGSDQEAPAEPAPSEPVTPESQPDEGEPFPDVKYRGRRLLTRDDGDVQVLDAGWFDSQEEADAAADALPVPDGYADQEDVPRVFVMELVAA